MRLQSCFSFEPVTNGRVDSVYTNPLMQEAQQRWGLHCNTRLCTFRFAQRESYNTSNGGHESPSLGSGGIIVAGALRFSGFHKGMLPEFLADLFNAAPVRDALKLRSAPNKTTSSTTLSHDGVVEYTELQCGWTSLEPFSRLVSAGIVRHVSTDANGSHDNNNNNNNNNNKSGRSGGDIEEESLCILGSRFPVVRRADVYLPHDIAVTDELRALFLLAHNTATCAGGGDYDCDDYDEWSTFSHGAAQSLATLRSVFTESERREFLYHILWRFIAGGGDNNQWDEDLGVYLDAARIWYKHIVAMRAVRRNETTCGTAVSDVDEPDQAVGVDKGAALAPEVVSTVVCVHAVSGISLFPRSDDATPSNLNYCYVCIDPVEAEVVVWYHCM